MDLISHITVEITTERGVRTPTFILHTDMPDQASGLLHLLRLWPLPINLALLRTLSAASNVQFPSESVLRVEWAFEDRDPDHAFEVYIPHHLHELLIQANMESRSLSVILQSNPGTNKPSGSEAIPGNYAPFILDWYGILGISVLIRRTWQHTISPDKVDVLLTLLQQRLTASGPATGLYTELGYLYRLKEEWQKAIDCYTHEIRFGLRPDGKPGLGCMKALCNLGVAYKKLQALDRARDCFALALYLNPNYFEVLLSLSGILQDTDTALQCLGRGYRLRPQDPNIPLAIRNMCASRALPLKAVVQRIEQIAAEMDMTQPLPQFHLDDPCPTLHRLGLGVQLPQT